MFRNIDIVNSDTELASEILELMNKKLKMARQRIAELEAGLKSAGAASKVVEECAGCKRWLDHRQQDQNFTLNQAESNPSGDPPPPNHDGQYQYPYRALLQRLTGIGGGPKPKLNTGTNIWRRGHRNIIEEEAKRRLQVQGRNMKKDLASIRESVVKEMFEQLSKEEKDEWKRVAKDEHAEAMGRWEKELNERPRTDSGSRQRCIQALAPFAQPILDGICEATGWKCTLLAGGPEPATGGRLKVIGVHSGTIEGDTNMDFGRTERTRWDKFIAPIFGDFLRKCYTHEECSSMALSGPGGFRPLKEGGLNVNIVKLPPDVVASPANQTPHVNATHPDPSQAHHIPTVNPSLLLEDSITPTSASSSPSPAADPHPSFSDKVMQHPASRPSSSATRSPVTSTSPCPSQISSDKSLSQPHLRSAHGPSRQIPFLLNPPPSRHASPELNTSASRSYNTLPNDYHNPVNATTLPRFRRNVPSTQPVTAVPTIPAKRRHELKSGDDAIDQPLPSAPAKRRHDSRPQNVAGSDYSYAQGFAPSSEMRHIKKEEV